MKGIVYTKDDPLALLQLMEMKKPTPKAHQVLIEVRASSINASDSVKFLKRIGEGKPLALPRSVNADIPQTTKRPLDQNFRVLLRK
jgi:NADPH:quinone reductase-like Zn-dependent oxidoreductase